jgi:hypothetical protein
MDGDVSAVRVDEPGADMYGSWTSRSLGETVLMFVEVLEALEPKSKTLCRAGDEYAELAPPPSKLAKSPRSMSGCEGERLTFVVPAAAYEP